MGEDFRRRASIAFIAGCRFKERDPGERLRRRISRAERDRERERKERGGSWGARPVLIIMHSVECCNYRAASLMHLSGWAYEKWTIVSFIWKWNGRGWTECDEKFWWPTETIILFLPFGEISHLCAFYRSEWDFLLLLFPLFLRSLCIILYRRWLKWKKRKKKKERSIVSII